MKNNYTEVWRIFVNEETVGWGEKSKSRKRLLRVQFDLRGDPVENGAGKFLKQHYPVLLKEFQKTFGVK